MTRSRILVIDDDPLFRSLITSMLRRDYFVSVAGDGSEGYYKALEHPPQLAIIDVQMPGWDGLRTLQAMRAHQALAKVPVMMLTSDASRQTVLASIQSGANDYVIKTTLSRDELLKKARRLVKLAPEHVNPGQDVRADQSSENSTIAVGTDGKLSSVPAAAGDADVDTGAESEAARLQALIDNWE
jgi:DNA-binding response OmpR family regulator